MPEIEHSDPTPLTGHDGADGACELILCELESGGHQEEDVTKVNDIARDGERQRRGGVQPG